MSSQAAKSDAQKSNGRRERLLDIQKREQLKGLLINKFKVKYGDKPNIASYIDNEVQKFLKNDRLTEENLKKLDDKINKESLIRDKKEDILNDRRSQQSANGVAGGPKSTVSSRKSGANGRTRDDDTRSIASQVMSGQSKISKNSQKPQSVKKDPETVSLNSSQRPKTEHYSEIDEDDEWEAILKFNTLLHYEEQKQAMLRERERKRLIKEELEKQLSEKKERKVKENQEDLLYQQLQQQHLQLLEQREQEKLNEQRRKILQEKQSRDKQLQEEQLRKKREQRETFKQEVDLVNRLHQEMDQERAMLMEKRKQEKEYLQKMLKENERRQQKMKEEKDKERMDDIRSQEEYTKMIERQEQDRINEFKAREKRAQDFMNKMADTVLKDMDEMAREEEMKIRRYEMEKELRERMEDERRMKRMREDQLRTRDFLNKQMEEKKHRERMEKALNDEQAEMWNQDKVNYEEEERRLNEKIYKINKDNQQFLMTQMSEKSNKTRTKMNKQEFLLNKQILKEINQKKKDGSLRGPASINGDGFSHKA